MQVMNTPPFIAPHPETLRPWVQDCLVLLEVSAASVSKKMGMGRNTLGDFLGKPGRSIDLKTVHVLTCVLRDTAADRQMVLPRLRVRANG
ncbi:MAG: hypothetical protein COB16_06615 [Rhodobacteraceae bacterium]|nr:MAG: hypothetical protein COB16_06615 [Paracoccaceae bacterium]